jgi:hypothetical protein
MKLKIVLVILSIQLNICLAQQDSIIVWSTDKDLEQFDFRASIPDSILGTNIEGEIRHYIKVDYKILTKDTFSMEIYPVFLCNESWLRKDSPRGILYLLNHEQGHFNIAEVISRKLRKHILNNSNIESNKLSKIQYSYYIQYMYNTYVDSLYIMHEKYDSETNFSMDSVMQAKWDLKIASMLRSLEDYKEPLIVIKFE